MITTVLFSFNLLVLLKYSGFVVYVWTCVYIYIYIYMYIYVYIVCHSLCLKPALSAETKIIPYKVIEPQDERYSKRKAIKIVKGNKRRKNEITL